MKNKKCKADYIAKAEDRIIKYLERTHITSNAMVVHQLAETSKTKFNPHIVIEALHKLLKEGVILKKEKPFPNQVKIPCYIYKYSKCFKSELIEQKINQIYPYLDKLKNNKNPKHNKLHKQLGYALEIHTFKRLNQLAVDNHYELQERFEKYTANDYSKAKKARKLFDLAKLSLQQWINKEITLAQLYQTVKYNITSEDDIKTTDIKNNIDFIKKFTRSRNYTE